MSQTIFYITGFRQHAGKTTTCLGLLSLLRNFYDPEELAYIKPVGQELVLLPDGSMVDKDAKILQQFSMIPDMDLLKVSPVRLGSGFTKDYLDSENQKKETKMLHRLIISSLRSLHRKKIIVAEGTGHPGVGSIVGLSNARVGNIMNAEILYLSGGGIGKALDMLEIDLSYYLLKKSKLRGVIFNKLIPDKMDQTKKYLNEDLLQRKFSKFKNPLQIFGYLPEIEELYKPSMRLLQNLFKDIILIGDPEDDSWTVPCRKVRIIALPARFFYPEKYIKPRDLILIAASSKKRISMIIKYNRSLKEGNKIGGVIITCYTPESRNIKIEKMLKSAGIPAFYVNDDTSTTEQIILDSFESTKIQTYDENKMKKIEYLFAEHFDIEKFMHTFKLKR